jgi:hypothetical protein
MLSWLHRFPSRIIGNNIIFIYWDKKGECLEFNIFDHVKYFYIPNKSIPAQLWEWYWQKKANIHFRRWIRENNEDEFFIYLHCINRKFHRKDY